MKNKHIKRLQRRADHLEERIKNRNDDSSNYDKAELSALKWVIKLAEGEINERTY